MPSRMRGGIVMCPPSALGDRWSRRFGDPVNAFASGWMRVRGRARQHGVELPLVVSDHVDWPELIADGHRDRRRRNLGDARARGCARPLSRDARAQGAGAGARRPRRGGRIAMRAFARLLDCLVYTQSRNRKVALLGRYFRIGARPRSRLGFGGADRRRADPPAVAAHADGSRQPLHRSGSLPAVARLRRRHGRNGFAALAG